MNIVVLVIDDTRWDSIGAAGNRIVRTPRIDALASDGVRFTQARVATSICMTSRASLLTGQYMSRHGIDRFGKQLTPDAFARTYPGVLRSAGYWTGYVGKYDVGPPRPADFDFLRAYHGRHWLEGANGERVHVTEQNARDSIDFLRARPKDKPFLLSVGYFAPHAEDNAKEQYLPQDWSAASYEHVKVPPSPLGDAKYLRALPPFLSSDSNEGRVRFKWRFDTPERYQEYMIRYYRLITEVDAAVGRIVDELKAPGRLRQHARRVHRRQRVFPRRPWARRQVVSLRAGAPRAAHRPGSACAVPDARRREGSACAQHRRGTHDPCRRRPPRTGRDAGARPEPAVHGGQSPGLPAWRDEFFYEHPTITSRDRIPSSQGVIRRDWKYVYCPEFDYEQLFNLKEDGQEFRNLAR